ncbi:flavodoxin domain containing protein [Theileria equi strain WA]|uniref:Flavodoxin domain containing protein n=1 Tax=Theileria equi strain WA TaxID=1537102 RepID=L1LFA5_THEEQ|nr:flavodoxin domain containing protein [Theileria equi strain WA]EKX73930.1 flavodoxin domain containing protein [Theileria equi strain WA]|eukprot:XP_004833382.1 flavodoxin domain containing protein [Theileria equi strain WA]
MRVSIIYATETGASEVAAFETYLFFYKRGLSVDVYNASSISLLTLFSYDYTIFFIPTAAFGEFPRGISHVVEAIIAVKHVPISYTIFGLGDSRYPLYNYAARKFQTLLNSVGATLFFPVALGDDQHPMGYDGELVVWRQDLLSHLDPSAPTVDRRCSYTFPYAVRYVQGVVDSEKVEFAAKSGTIKGNRVMTSETHFMDVHSVWVQGEFETGDVCCIYPEDNSARKMLQGLNFDPDMYIVLTKSSLLNTFFGDSIDTISSIRSKPSGWTMQLFYRAPWIMGPREFMHLPKIQPVLPSVTTSLPLGVPITLLELFTKYLCLSNTCTQFQMQVMSFYTNDKLHKSKLLEMSQDSVQGILEYYRYCKRERRSLFEVLYDFSSVSIPLDVLINIATPMYPRLYSIASSRECGLSRPLISLFPLPSIHRILFDHLVKYGKDIEAGFELIVAKTKYDTPSGRVADGLCSNYLANLRVGSSISYTLLRSQYSSLLDISRPVLFICTGTGISACKPYMEARAVKFTSMQQKTGVLSKVKDLAFLGFRRPNQDNLYADVSLVQGRCKVHYVFSRSTGKKYYVQDALLREAKDVCKVILSGVVMISGRSHPMPASVLDAFRAILMQEANFGQVAADKFIYCSLKEKKIIVDTWG